MVAMAQTLPSICYRKRVSLPALVVIAAASAACAGRTPTERERALERIPAQAQVIAAADGPALSTPSFRRVLDAAGPHVPSGLACVLDAAAAGSALAVGVHVDGGVTVVLATRGTVARCPALGKIADGLYVATIGAGALAADRAHSVLDDPTWERARPYLLREPFALAVERPTSRAIAVAQPDPIDAWLAVDAVQPEALEQTIEQQLARWRGTGAGELAGKLAVKRTGTQVAIASERLTEADLVTIVTDTLRALDAQPTARAPSFSCPGQTRGIVSCHDGTQLVVTSIPETLIALGRVDASPVVSGGDIIGIRLLGDPPPVFRRDDVILAVDAHRITEPRQLVNLAGKLGDEVSIAVRRGGHDAVVQLRE
jgi:hypothetical protein